MGRFSETVTDHFVSPRNFGKMPSPDRVGLVGQPGQSGYLVLSLRTSGDRIEQAMYQCHNCGATIAAGSVLTEMISGKSIADCRTITVDRLLEALDGLPPDKLHCAVFAVRALQQALDGGTS